MPIVAIALVAVAVLLPESRAAKRPSLDIPGIVVSSAGLAALTYGFIRAGQESWTDSLALATICAGALVLAGFVWWERFVAMRGGQPLVDLALFRLAGFRWGTILMTMVSFAMFGLLFTAPLYFQDVRGATPLGSGMRLLPLIGGMLIGMIAGSRLCARGETHRWVSDAPKLPDGTRGTRGSARSSPWRRLPRDGRLLGDRRVHRAGILDGLRGAVDHGDRPRDRDGDACRDERRRRPADGGAQRLGCALISAVRQVGATIGVAVLGTLLSNGYTSQLHLDGLPASAAAAVRSSVAGGVAVAGQLGSAALLDEVRTAFIHGMDVMLWTCGGIALASALLAFAFLPRRSGSVAGPAAAEATPRKPAARPRLSGHNGSVTSVDLKHHGSLRERKKARTRASIREHALRLFREQGYQATTVEQIAAAAEVSPSTFFRYFPTKEDVVLRDDFDERVLEAFERQPSSSTPLAALRAAIREAVTTLTPAEWAEFHETAALSVTVPEVRARTLDELSRTINAMADSLAKRTGRTADDLAVRTYVGAIFGVMMSIIAPGDWAATADIGEQTFQRIDEALALLEEGLPL